MGRRLLVLALLLGAPRLARAQAAGAPPPAACHADTIGVDTTVDSLYGWVPAIETDESEAQHAFQVTQVRAVLAALRPIASLGIRNRPPRYDRDPKLGRTPLEGALALVWFQVREDGRLAGLSVINWSGWDSLDLALQRAILRADSLRALRPLPPELAGEAVDLWLGVGPWQGDAVADVPVARIVRTRPRVRGAVQPPRLLSWGYTPRGPDDAARLGIGDKILVRFVVDTAGRVEPDSIVFLQASFREYAQEVLKLVRSARFLPAHVGPCPIRASHEMSIFFQPGTGP